MPTAPIELTASEITTEPVVQHTSYSQISSYMRCSMKYYFQYIKKMPQRPNLSLTTGSAGHTAVEWNARYKIRTTANAPIQDFLDIGSTAYDAETHQLEPSDLEPGENINRNKDAHMALLDYYGRVEAPKYNPVAAELAFNIDIPATEEYQYPLKIVQGRIDLLIPDVIDNKFTGRAKSQGEVDLTDQLTMYDLALEQHGITAPALGFQVFLQANTRDGPRVQQLRRGPEFMAPEARKNRHHRLVQKMRTIHRAIDQGIFIPTDDPMKCARCEYRTICQFSLAKNDYDALSIRQKGPG